MIKAFGYIERVVKSDFFSLEKYLFYIMRVQRVLSNHGFYIHTVRTRIVFPDGDTSKLPIRLEEGRPVFNTDTEFYQVSMYIYCRDIPCFGIINVLVYFNLFGFLRAKMLLLVYVNAFV